jgi:hypothetical protein
MLTLLVPDNGGEEATERSGGGYRGMIFKVIQKDNNLVEEISSYCGDKGVDDDGPVLKEGVHAVDGPSGVHHVKEGDHDGDHEKDHQNDQWNGQKIFRYFLEE